jgi:hypothetical protein
VLTLEAWEATMAAEEDHIDGAKLGVRRPEWKENSIFRRFTAPRLDSFGEEGEYDAVDLPVVFDLLQEASITGDASRIHHLHPLALWAHLAVT